MLKNIKISQLQCNTGQIDGLPKNPRTIKDARFEALKKSIEDAPEMLALRELLVFPHNDKFVVIGGNMRLKACKDLGYKELPCKVIDENTPVEKLREYAIKDNIGFGEDDWNLLTEDWDRIELEDWGMEFPENLNVDEPQDTESVENEVYEEVEEKLNDCVRFVCQEIKEQYDKLNGFSFISPNTAKFDFIKFCYYNKEYPRYNSLAFHNLQFKTAGDKLSTYDGLNETAKGKIKAERLRFVCNDDFRKIIIQSLAFCGAKMPLDFPASLAKSLINEFGNCGKILDPCAGWGGRMIGFLASNADEYFGVDASPYQCDGDKKIYETFKDVALPDKKVTIVNSAFQNVDLRNEYFDFAITSPPYFDTEKYLGGEQSHELGNYDNWKSSFYEVLIRKTFDALKTNGVFCLQIGSQRYPLLYDGREIAERIGFVVLDIRNTDMKNSFNKTEFDKGERILIIQKK